MHRPISYNFCTFVTAMVKAVVFDIGGVLIGLDLDRCIRAFRENLGYERITELLDPCHQKGIYGDMEAGLITGRMWTAPWPLC